MQGYMFDYEEARGVLVMRVDADFPNSRFDEYCAALRSELAAARKHGPLKLLSDNRDNKIFGQERAEILWTILHENADPADRIALLMANNLAKHQSRAKTGDRAQPFASANAAYTWLCAGSSLAA